MYGYAGKILQVDLTKEKAKIDVLKVDEAKKYVGGIGHAIKLVYDNTKPNVDPLSPENVLVLTTGPMSGIMAPTGSGHVFAAKSPLTGGIGASVVQGLFASNMKSAGYDAIVLKGKSRRATFLWVNDDLVQFMDARDLWGKSPARTEETIKKDLGDSSIRVATIGLAGEKLARIACIVSDRTRVAGGTGMGAVMGSKNLKAIAVLGSKDLEVADPNGLLEFCREFYLRARGSAAVKYYRGLGTSEVVAVKDRVWATTHGYTAKYRGLGTSEDILMYNALGCLPTRNFSTGTFEGAEKVSGDFLNEHYVAKIQACSSCSISCEHIAIVQEGPYKGTAVRTEYGPLWAFGPHCGIDRLDAILKATELCYYYGLDAVSTGNIIGFAMDCYERGILAYEDIDCQDLRFGNHEAMFEMIRKIGSRKGLGDTLADGVKWTAQKIGGEAEMLANHIKGVEMTGYDLRCSETAALGFAVSFQGPNHNWHGAQVFDLSGEVNRFTVEEGRGKLVKDREDLYAVMDSLIVCKFLIGIYEGFEDLARLYNFVTGFGMTAEELKLIGERINNLARVFNVREGFTRGDDHLPPKVMSVPIPEGVSKGSVVTEEELNLLLDDYYEKRGWTKKGTPTEKKLRELGIQSIKEITG